MKKWTQAKTFDNYHRQTNFCGKHSLEIGVNHKLSVDQFGSVHVESSGRSSDDEETWSMPPTVRASITLIGLTHEQLMKIGELFMQAAIDLKQLDQAIENEKV